MSANEATRVLVEMTFTTENGEIPDTPQLERLIADQMSGPLDDHPDEGGTGLGCMAVAVTASTSELNAKPVVLAYGSPEEGLTLVGPTFPNDANLEEATDVHLRNNYWWYVPLTSLPDFIASR